jgi:hypothetical protein
LQTILALQPARNPSHLVALSLQPLPIFGPLGATGAGV